MQIIVHGQPIVSGARGELSLLLTLTGIDVTVTSPENKVSTVSIGFNSARNLIKSLKIMARRP